jgi:hypothetical protein
MKEVERQAPQEPGARPAVGCSHFYTTCCLFGEGRNDFDVGPSPLSNDPSNGFACIQVIKSKRHIKKQFHWQFYVPERLYSLFCIFILYSEYT